MNNKPVVELLSSDTAEVNAAVIWLHGLGANGHDFVPIVPQLQLPADYGVRFVFPNAPSIPVTINGGLVMPAWYDILQLDNLHNLDEAGLHGSAGTVHELIRRELDRGVDSERIVLAGFSQGGAVCFEAGLSCAAPLGGIIALSTYFPTATSVVMQPAQQRLPVLVCHGLLDSIVPEALGRASVESLQALGLEPEYQTYPMAHEVCMPELNHIGRWLENLLAT